MRKVNKGIKWCIMKKLANYMENKVKHRNEVTCTYCFHCCKLLSQPFSSSSIHPDQNQVSAKNYHETTTLFSRSNSMLPMEFQYSNQMSTLRNEWLQCFCSTEQWIGHSFIVIVLCAAHPNGANTHWKRRHKLTHTHKKFDGSMSPTPKHLELPQLPSTRPGACLYLFYR